MSTAKELRQKGDKELQDFLSESRVKLHGLALKAAMKQLKNVSEIGHLKRDIARCLTIRRERNRT